MLDTRHAAIKVCIAGCRSFTMLNKSCRVSHLGRATGSGLAFTGNQPTGLSCRRSGSCAFVPHCRRPLCAHPQLGMKYTALNISKPNHRLSEWSRIFTLSAMTRETYRSKPDSLGPQRTVRMSAKTGPRLQRQDVRLLRCNSLAGNTMAFCTAVGVVPRR